MQLQPLECTTLCPSIMNFRGLGGGNVWTAATGATSATKNFATAATAGSDACCSGSHFGCARALPARVEVLWGARFFLREPFKEADAAAAALEEAWAKRDCDQLLSMASMCEGSAIGMGLVCMGPASCCSALKLMDRKDGGAAAGNLTGGERWRDGILGSCTGGAAKGRGVASACCCKPSLLRDGLNSDGCSFSLNGSLASLHCGHLSRRRPCSHMPPPPHGTQ